MSTLLHATYWGVVRSVSLTVGRAVGHGYWFDTHTGGGETKADILNATHRAFKWEVICSVFWIIQDKFRPSVWRAAWLCQFLLKNVLIVEEHYNQNTFLRGTNSYDFLLNVVAKQIMQPCLSLCVACQQRSFSFTRQVHMISALCITHCDSKPPWSSCESLTNIRHTSPQHSSQLL